MEKPRISPVHEFLRSVIEFYSPSPGYLGRWRHLLDMSEFQTGVGGGILVSRFPRIL